MLRRRRPACRFESGSGHHRSARSRQACNRSSPGRRTVAQRCRGGRLCVLSACRASSCWRALAAAPVVANADVGFQLNGLQDVTVNVVVSDDGGATWSNLNLELLTVLGGGPAWHHATTVVPAGAHPAGETRRYAIRTVR